MKKCTVFAALLCASLAVMAAIGYAGRQSVTYTTRGVISNTNLVDGVRLSCLTVKYSVPTNVTLYVSAIRSNVTNLIYKVDVSASDSVFIVSEGLWLKKRDSLIFSNSIPVSATAQADYMFN